MSKSGKLNGVGKIFLDLFDMSKYPLITTIHFIIDDVEASQSFQPNGSKMFGVPYCLNLKLNSQHSIDYFLTNIQKDNKLIFARELRKIYSSPKPVVKMKPNKLLAARIITSIHARRGRVVKLKSARYQLADDILLKRNFGNHLWQ